MTGRAFEKLILDNAPLIGGYNGVKNTAHLIQKFIPKAKIYVEPFAGMGRTCDVNKHEKIILNDMSDYAVSCLRKTFPDAIITQEDFRDCIKKWDSKNTFFLIDPPWDTRTYKIDSKAYCNMKAQQYYRNLLYLIQYKIEGNWIVLSKAASSPTENWKYNKIVVESEKAIIHGQTAKTMITSNLPLCETKEKEGISK